MNSFHLRVHVENENVNVHQNNTNKSINLKDIGVDTFSIEFRKVQPKITANSVFLELF